MGNRIALVLIAVLVASCTGPTGPAGPAGPAGPQGLPGPAGSVNFYRITTTLNSNGAVSVALPAVVGTDINRPPVMSCYTGSTTTNSWLSVSDGYTSTSTPYCGVTFSAGVWNAVMAQGTAGWFAAFVVAY